MSVESLADRLDVIWDDQWVCPLGGQWVAMSADRSVDLSAGMMDGKLADLLVAMMDGLK